MVELGGLEKNHAEFEKRNVRVIVISNDDQKTSQETQTDFPHLVVIADTEQKMAKAFEVLHTGAGATGDDTNAPTTFLVDGTGQVRDFYRPNRFIERQAPAELLTAIDAKLVKRP
jgi:peroxiredoxin